MGDHFQDTGLMFGDLLEYLRQQGFLIGVDSHLRLQKVLGQVSGSCSPDELRTLLCPILATDKKQQAFFYSAFDAYLGLKQFEAVLPEYAELPAGNKDVAEPYTIPLQARRWPYLILGLILAVIVAWASYYRERLAQFTQGGTPAPTALTPTPTPGLATTLTDEPVPELIKPIRWLALFFPPLFLSLYELYLYNRRNLLLRMLNSSHHPYIFPIRPAPPSNSIFESERFYHSARLLKHRQVAELHSLDIPATVNETIKGLGYPSLRFKRASKMPEYLVLIERVAYRDHLSRFCDELIRALEREGLLITRYYYEGDPRVCFAPAPEFLKTNPLLPGAETGKNERAIPLKEILNKHEDCRLLIFGNGEGLVEPITGVKAEWTSIFDQWKERALLTPISPTEWASRELRLSSQFLIAPATLDGLRALVDYYEFNELIPPQKWPRREPPLSLDVDSPDILTSLRIYLGEKPFQWLCACAVYPVLQWELTVYIGSLPHLEQNLASELNILRLIRLPWFRSGFIPKHLRRLLIQELPPEVYKEVRAAIVNLMNQAGQYGEAIEENANQLNVAIPRSLTSILQSSLRNILNIRPKNRIFRDHIFIQFLESRPSMLGLSLPAGLSKIFYPNGNTALRMKLGVRILLTLLISLTVWMAAPQIVRAVKTEQALTAQIITSPAGALPSPLATTSPTPPLNATPSPTATATPVNSPQPQPSPAAVTSTPVAGQTPQEFPSPTTTPVSSEPPPLIIITPTPVSAGTPASLPQPPTPVADGGTEGTAPPERGQTVPLTPSLDTRAICPKVRIRALNVPSFTAQNTISYSLNAEATGGKALQPSRYLWRLSNSQARIIVGQDTPTVSILWPAGNKEAAELTVRVTVTGYNFACPTETSWTVQRVPATDDDKCCASCGELVCCANPGYCISCGECGSVCCNEDEP